MESIFNDCQEIVSWILAALAPQAAAEKLIAGEIDAAFIVTGWDSPVVQSLLNADGIEARGELLGERSENASSQAAELSR
jgi:hypothetical protein